MSKEHIVVIGAGWAGLAAAVQLTQQGHKVTVFESAKQAGGRARAVEYNDITVDNGQRAFRAGFDPGARGFLVFGGDAREFYHAVSAFVCGLTLWYWAKTIGEPAVDGIRILHITPEHRAAYSRVSPQLPCHVSITRRVQDEVGGT